MQRQVIITLPEELYENARRWALMTHREVPETWSEDGVFIVGLTASGRATVVALNLNNLVAMTVRRNWIAAGWHPPLQYRQVSSAW